MREHAAFYTIVKDFLMHRASIPALFNALAMHLFVMCTSTSTERELAENRARTSMLSFDALQQCWPAASWVYLMFKTVLDKLETKFKAESSTRAQRRDRQAAVEPVESVSSVVEVPNPGSGYTQGPESQGWPIKPPWPPLDSASAVEDTSQKCDRGATISLPAEASGPVGEMSGTTEWAALLHSVFEVPTDTYQANPDEFFKLLDIPAWEFGIQEAE